MLEVEITGPHSFCEVECPLGDIVGRLILSRRKARLSTALGCGVGVCQVGRLDHICIQYRYSRILAGGSPWQV